MCWMYVCLCECFKIHMFHGVLLKFILSISDYDLTSLIRNCMVFHSFSAVCSSSSLATTTGVLSQSLPRTQKSSFSPLRQGRKRLRRSTSVTDLTQQQHHNNHHKSPFLSQKSLQYDDDESHQIQRIITKIQQDNKILAQLDHNSGELLFFR